MTRWSDGRLVVDSAMGAELLFLRWFGTDKQSIYLTFELSHQYEIIINICTAQPGNLIFILFFCFCFLHLFFRSNVGAFDFFFLL